MTSTPIGEILFVACIAAGVAWIFLRRANAAARHSPRELDFLSRPESFSFLIFEGDVRAFVPELLEACSYGILESTPISGELRDVYDAITSPEGENNEIVSKVGLAVANRTVLLEPEMVLWTLNGAEIARFCSAHGTTAVAAIWERYSETIILDVQGPTGVVSSTRIQQDEGQDGSVRPNQRLIANPSVTTLRALLEESGVDVDALFGRVEGTKYRLSERDSV